MDRFDDFGYLGWETADGVGKGIAGSGDRKSRDFGVGNRWAVGKTAGSDLPPKKPREAMLKKNHMVLIPLVLQAGTLRVPEFKVQTRDPREVWVRVVSGVPQQEVKVQLARGRLAA